MEDGHMPGLGGDQRKVTFSYLKWHGELGTAPSISNFWGPLMCLASRARGFLLLASHWSFRWVLSLKQVWNSVLISTGLGLCPLNHAPLCSSLSENKLPVCLTLLHSEHPTINMLRLANAEAWKLAWEASHHTVLMLSTGKVLGHEPLTLSSTFYLKGRDGRLISGVKKIPEPWVKEN